MNITPSHIDWSVGTEVRNAKHTHFVQFGTLDGGGIIVRYFFTDIGAKYFAGDMIAQGAADVIWERLAPPKEIHGQR